MERKTVVLIGLLLSLTGAVQAVGPDIYDPAFQDDSTDTTVNLLELNAGQDHTFDRVGDVDWAIPVLTGEDTYPYTVRVEPVGAGIDPAFVVLGDAGTTLTAAFSPPLSPPSPTTSAGRPQGLEGEVNFHEVCFALELLPETPGGKTAAA